jgi:Protein of unknown function (DUF2975)
MKPSVFRPLVNGLYYVSSIAFFGNVIFVVVFGISFLFRDLLWSKYNIDLSITKLMYTIRVPVRLDFNKEPDTTIVFLNKKTKAPLAIGDTTVSIVTPQKPSAFRFSKPVRVKGYLEATPTDASGYWWLKWLNGCGIVATLLCYVLLLSRFRLLLDNIRKNVFFSTQNFTYLRTMAFLLVLIPLIESLRQRPVLFFTNLYNNGYLFKHSDFVHKTSDGIFAISSDWSLNFDFSILNSSFFMGVSILVLAEIFRYGINLQHENELTI